MPKLILVSFFVPPDNSPCSIRAVRIVEHLSRRGWNILVIASRMQTTRLDVSLMQRWPPDVEIVCCGFKSAYFSLTELWKKVLSRDRAPSRATANETVVPPEASLPGSRIRRLISKLAYGYYYPDLFAPWIKPAVKSILSIHRDDPADVLLTTAGPWSSLFVGYQANRITGLPWVIDYRDPWTVTHSAVELMRPPERTEQDRAWQRRFLQQCTLAKVVSEETLEAYEEQYGVSRQKLTVLPIGYDDIPNELSYAQSESQRGLFVISYVGNMTMMILSPFLRALSLWLAAAPERWGLTRLRFVGEIGESHKKEIESHGLDSIVEYLGVVSRDEAWQETCSATILLLLWYSTTRAYSPGSKLFTYLAAGKPVLAVVPPGSSARIVQESGQGIVAGVDDVEAIKKALDMLWNTWLARQLSVRFPMNEKCLRQYSQKRIMESLDRSLRAVLTSGGN